MIIKPQLLLLFFVALASSVQAQRSGGPTRVGATSASVNVADVPKGNENLAASQPESGAVTGGSYDNRYFALSYPIPSNWTETVKGPPPSDTGYYVLDSFKLPQSERQSNGKILIAAWDLFFVPHPVKNAFELIKDIKGSLPDVYQVEAGPMETKIAGHSFVRLDYKASVAELHWRVLATEIRCHLVEFVLTGRDVDMLEDLVRKMNKLELPEGADAVSGTGGGPFPVCIKDYASGANVLRKVDPVMAGPRYSNVPVRVIIGADGKLRHIHVISASPEQDKSVREALAQWAFQPYIQNGVPVEVETGILFKFPPDGAKLPPVPEKY